MNQYKNLEKIKYCKYCNIKTTVRNWSDHCKRKKHKNNVKYPSKQIPITFFLKKYKK